MIDDPFFFRWQPEFCDWAFNLKRGDPLRAVWKKIPTDTDILMTHGPPIGHGDLTTHGNRTGCVDLFMEIHKRIKPKYHIFGHIHVRTTVEVWKLSLEIDVGRIWRNYKWSDHIH